MGIPVFFKTLITDYQHVIEPVANQKIDNLFFDLNCLLHPSCAQIKDGNEDEMIKKILFDINHFIQLTGATFIYIAIDGPAPKAKMMQQRVRRLKSVLEEKVWDTNALTPGTKFMNRLNDELHKVYDINKVYDSHMKVVLSDSLEPGEGEHKILQYIKQHKDIFKKQKNCIYGLDADLIMLALVSGIPNIVLLRERTSFNIEQMEGDYLYLKIDALKKEITSSFPQLTKQTVINDYIFICFFLGNDFIKNSPSLKLRYDGLNHITEAYKQCQDKYSNKFYLINPRSKGIIHWNNFKEFISLLNLQENDRMKNMFSIRMKQHRKYKHIYDNIQRNKGNVITPPSTSSTKNNTLGYPAEDIMRHKPIIFMNNEIKIFTSNDWIQNYNLFTCTGSFDPYPVNELSEQVNQVCRDYIQSIVWTTHYYFNKCVSQEWFYPHEHAPSLHDVHTYLQSNKQVRVKEHLQTYTPLEQLLFVFPYQSYHLCDELEPVDESNYITKLDKEFSLLKRYDWECHPIF
jgi:5'-3' exonuclease